MNALHFPSIQYLFKIPINMLPLKSLHWNRCFLALAILPGFVPAALAQDTAVRQSFGFKFSGNLYTSVADFGRKDFDHALSSALQGFDLPSTSWGAEIQFGLTSSKRWGTGVELASLMNTSSKQASFKYANVEAGLYGEYIIVKRPRFEFVGQLSLGITQGFLSYEHWQESPGSDIALEDYMKSNTLNIRQKILGYAAMGFSADYVVSSDFSVGLFVRWVQQIGRGYWYASMSDARIADIPKSSRIPLNIGLAFSFSSLD